MIVFEPKPMNPYSVINPDLIEQNQAIKMKISSCDNVEWMNDMGSTVPYCKIDLSPCNAQCLKEEEYNNDDWETKCTIECGR